MVGKLFISSHDYVCIFLLICLLSVSSIRFEDHKDGTVFVLCYSVLIVLIVCGYSKHIYRMMGAEIFLCSTFVSLDFICNFNEYFRNHCNLTVKLFG
jgi:hypothetical protein